MTRLKDKIVLITGAAGSVGKAMADAVEAAGGVAITSDLAGRGGANHALDVTSEADWLRVIADGLSREDPRVPSVTFMWKGAEWMEREAYDMFGITFEGNRDLRRIYMPPDYQSFPLRKDFYLADDAARSPGAGVRPMEQTHQPRNAPATATVRRAGA